MSASECHCDAKDVPHTHDWLVLFAHKVAAQRDYCRRHPGSVFIVMLREEEAEGLLAELQDRSPEGSS